MARGYLIRVHRMYQTAGHDHVLWASMHVVAVRLLSGVVALLSPAQAHKRSRYLLYSSPPTMAPPFPSPAARLPPNASRIQLS